MDCSFAYYILFVAFPFNYFKYDFCLKIEINKKVLPIYLRSFCITEYICNVNSGNHRFIKRAHFKFFKIMLNLNVCENFI